MGWWAEVKKKLSGNILLECEHDPVVKEVLPDPPLNISEPVFTFIEYVKKYPNRFTFKYESRASIWRSNGILVDRYNKKEYHVTRTYHGPDETWSCSEAWLTKDEVNYLGNVLCEFLNDRAKSRRSLTNERRTRKVRMEKELARQQAKGMYVL